MKFQSAYKSEQLHYGSGNVAIVTGWTPKEKIIPLLEEAAYAIIGQLYSSTRGMDYLIRNLIANTYVRYIVVLNATSQDRLAGGCQCLLDFFRNGFKRGRSDSGRECWVVRSIFYGYIDIEIPEEILNLLRSLVAVIEVKTESELVESVAKINTDCIPLPEWGIPALFPKDVYIPLVLPGNIYGHRVEGKTIAETWVKIIHRIKTTGIIRPSKHDSDWQELINLMAIVTDEPEDYYFPEPNYLPCDRAYIDKYIPQMLSVASDDGVEYSYGSRLRKHFGRNQIEQVIKKLSKSIDSASAVMSLWDVKDHESSSGSPCLNHIWLRIVDNRLSLTALFRSNDMFSAWVANAMQLRALQRLIFQEVKLVHQELEIGYLMTISESAHIYSECHEYVDKLIKEHYYQLVEKEYKKYDDPVGSYVIEIADDLIQVSRITPGSGELIKQYLGKDPLQLGRQICADADAISPMHSLYLGVELNKASIARKTHQIYVQDT
jgi:thymidylate synthase